MGTKQLKKSKKRPAQRRAPRRSKYASIIEAESKLKVGETLLGDPPKGDTARQLAVRLHSIEKSRIEQGRLKLPAGYKITKYTTETGQLGIYLEKKKR